MWPFGKLRTSWVTSEKNGPFSNIFGLRLIRQIEQCRTFGNPCSVKRESSVIFDNRRENRISTLLNIFGNPISSTNKASSGIRLFLRVKHCLSISSGTPWNIPLVTCIFLLEGLFIPKKFKWLVGYNYSIRGHRSAVFFYFPVANFVHDSCHLELYLDKFWTQAKKWQGYSLPLLPRSLISFAVLYWSFSSLKCQSSATLSSIPGRLGCRRKMAYISGQPFSILGDPGPVSCGDAIFSSDAPFLGESVGSTFARKYRVVRNYRVN